MTAEVTQAAPAAAPTKRWDLKSLRATAKRRVLALFEPSGADRPAVWHRRAPSVASVVARTKAGDWVKGDQHPAVEFPGRAWGYLVAVPLTAAGHFVIWVGQSATRTVIAFAVVTLVAVSW